MPLFLEMRCPSKMCYANASNPLKVMQSLNSGGDLPPGFRPPLWVIFQLVPKIVLLYTDCTLWAAVTCELLNGKCVCWDDLLPAVFEKRSPPCSVGDQLDDWLLISWSQRNGYQRRRDQCPPNLLLRKLFQRRIWPTYCLSVLIIGLWWWNKEIFKLFSAHEGWQLPHFRSNSPTLLQSRLLRQHASGSQ